MWPTYIFPWEKNTHDFLTRRSTHLAIVYSGVASPLELNIAVPVPLSDQEAFDWRPLTVGPSRAHTILANYPQRSGPFSLTDTNLLLPAPFFLLRYMRSPSAPP